MNFAVDMGILFCVAFVQNMAFTAVSRSRNSGDPSYHRYCAIASNGIWFVTNILITLQVWEAIKSGNWWLIAIAAAVYIIATTEGSVLMMKIMLSKESGKRKVGAS
jgi:hypothetical protein